MGWLFVPGLADLNSGSNSPLETAIDAWVTVSGKPSQRPATWIGWRTRPWIKRLFGTISRPSLANSTAARWISSLPDSHASRGPLPDKEKELKMSGGSGPISHESFAMWDPGSSSWKTSQVSLFGGGQSGYSENWPRWGSMRNGACFLQPTLEPAIIGIGSSFWLTPRAHSSAESSESFVKRNGDRKAGNFGTIEAQVKAWPTPRAEDSEACGNHPGASDSLNATARLWSTPQARDWKDQGSRIDRTGHVVGLGRQVLDRNPLETGTKSSRNAPKLNPLFEDWLMGWPIGWTASGPLGMAWSRWLRLMRSELLRLGRG